MATRIGLEPTTPSVTGWCSNQLSYRAMIAQVRAAFTAGTCPIIPEDGRLVKRKKQKSRKKDEKGGLPQSAHCIRSQLPQRGSLFAGAQRPHPRGGWHRAAMTGGGCLRKNKTSGTAAPEVCGRGSKSRTHGTRFWRPLLYQLSYTPKSMLHSLNACLLYKIRRKMSSINFQVLVLQPQQPSLAAGRLWASCSRVTLSMY